ncbi:hypothetical protein ACFSHQ_13275 [Gemmobacter lanyuensis]
MDTPVAETLALRQHPVPVDPQPAPRGPVAPVTDALPAEPLDAAPPRGLCPRQARCRPRTRRL